jgi:hypothetical protein
VENQTKMAEIKHNHMAEIKVDPNENYTGGRTGKDPTLKSGWKK